MEHFESVEKLVKTFGISYEHAKEVLEASNWDAVEAAILIEKENKAAEQNSPTEPVMTADSLKEQLDKSVKNVRKGTAAFFKKAADFIDETADGETKSAENESVNADGEPQPEQPKQSVEDSEAYKEAKRRYASAKEKTRGVIGTVVDFFDKNHFVVSKPSGETFLDLPLWVMIILLVMFFWILVGVLILTLILGFRFRFTGPQLGNLGQTSPKTSMNDDVPEPVVEPVEETAPESAPAEDNVEPHEDHSDPAA